MIPGTMKKLRAPSEDAFLRALNLLRQHGVEVRTYSSSRWIILSELIPSEALTALAEDGVVVTDAVQYDMD